MKFKLIVIYLSVLICINIEVNCISDNGIIKFKDNPKLVNRGKLEKSNDNDKLKCYFTKSDEDYIVNYKGGELEPEWQWAKNISVVYTWVDGSDPNFQYMKAKYDHGIRNDNSRFRSADELRYSLRSIKKYIPWHKGIIYIVTYHQIPKWLNTQNDRIQIIDHEQILPKYIYPTFDSNIIELFLDKIPGITERFLYFNDDVFLNNYVHPAFLFTANGFYPKEYKNNNKLNITSKNLKVNISKNLNIFVSINYFTQKLIRDYIDPDFIYFYREHSVFVLYRDLYEPFRLFFKEELRNSLAYRFRGSYKIQSLYLYQSFIKYIINDDDKKLPIDQLNSIKSNRKVFSSQGKESFYISKKNNTFKIKLTEKGKKINFLKNYKLPLNRTIVNYSLKDIPGNISKKYIMYGEICNDSKKNQEIFKEIKTNQNILIFNTNDNYSKNTVYYELSEFLFMKYTTPTSFEKSDFVTLENSLRDKIGKIIDFEKKMISSLPNNFDNSKIIHFQEVILQNKYTLFQEYLHKKKKLDSENKIENEAKLQCDTITDISDKEKDEIEFLLRYNGEELSEEWKWASDLSIVYVLDNYQNKTKEIINEIEQLKYSTRSIQKYLQWFKGIIYIVCNNDDLREIDWIRYSQLQIKIIDWTEILPNTVLVTKNTIEMYLDHIKGISERFIILQPNHIFLNPTHPLFFFNKSFYPKYHFKPLMSNNKLKSLKTYNPSLYYTYTMIKLYFGKFYVKVRELKNAAFPVYRDLFPPVRQLYNQYINSIENTKSNGKCLLPLYLISTYNVYGTEQPFYPDYVLGFGKIIHTKLPILPSNRTITYYGFDIASENIDICTMSSNFEFSNDLSKNTNKLFISIKNENWKQEKFIKYFDLLKKLFN